MVDSVKFILDENEIPKAWYNIVSDLPEPPAPVMHPGTGQPVGPDDLAPLFTMAAIMQEVSAERQIDIPEPVRDIYRQWRRARDGLRRRLALWDYYAMVTRWRDAGRHAGDQHFPTAFDDKQHA